MSCITEWVVRVSKERPKTCAAICTTIFDNRPIVYAIYVRCMAAYCMVDYHDQRQCIEPIAYRTVPAGHENRILHDGRGYIHQQCSEWTAEHYAALDIIVEQCCAALETEIKKRELYATLNSLSHGCRTPLTAMIDDAQTTGNATAQQQCLDVTATVVDFIEFHRQTIDPRVTQQTIAVQDLVPAWKNEYCNIKSETIDVDHQRIMFSYAAYSQAVWHICCAAYEPDKQISQISLYVQDTGDELEFCATFDKDVQLSIAAAYMSSVKRVAAPLSVYLACRIIEQMGGAMRLTENTTRQVQFVVPYYAAQLSSCTTTRHRSDNLVTHIPATHLPAANERLRILLAEDNQINQRAIRRMLEQYGTVDCANDGREALQLIERQQYAVIVLDIKMPGVDGYQVACFARQYNSAAKIIACTAQLVAHVDQDLFDHVIQKPIKKEILQQIFAAVA
jgi:CheY-like chemotaxis protein